MRPVARVSGRAYPWGAANVDTDLIIPARWLRTVSRSGLGAGAFESVRAQPGNVFDDPRFAGAPILIAGRNFGCGSSREHAAWAIADMGIGAIVAPSFSDIFAGNAFKNGIVTAALDQDVIEFLLGAAADSRITVDLEAMSVRTASGGIFTFSLDPFRRRCLLEGLHEIDVTLAAECAIDAHERAEAVRTPWIVPGVERNGDGG